MPQSLRDRISKRLQARSLSSRYGDFTFDSSLRRRRINRYSSVYMTSAEPTPLFNSPAPCQAQMPTDTKSQPAPWRSAIDPLATASLMLATVELDRLTNRQVSDRNSEVLGSGQSSACGGPPSSPALRSLPPGDKSSLMLNNTSCVSERSIIPRKPLPPGITMRSGNSVSQSTAHGGCRRRKTSSRISDIRNTENILEASDEDESSTSCLVGEPCPHPSLEIGAQSPYCSTASPAETVGYICAEGSESCLEVVPVNRLVEQTGLMQNNPSRGSGASVNASSGKTPKLQLNIFSEQCGQPQARKSPTNQLHTGALTPQNTRGLWCSPRKSPSTQRVQSMRDTDMPTGYSHD